MTRQIVIHKPPSINRRQPLLESQSSTGSVRFAEVAGGTTAECAAVCCCCPCGLINLLLLVLYKVPAGLCRRALRKRRRQRMIEKGLQPPLPHPPRLCRCSCDDLEFYMHPATAISGISVVPGSGEKPGKLEEPEEKEVEAEALEKEMWDRFFNTGFWRSGSQREHFVSVK